MRQGIKDLILPRAGLTPVPGLLRGLSLPGREGGKVSQLWAWRGSRGCAGAAVPPAVWLTWGETSCISPWPWTGATPAAFGSAGNSQPSWLLFTHFFLLLLVSFTGENGSV